MSVKPYVAGLLLLMVSMGSAMAAPASTERVEALAKKTALLEQQLKQLKVVQSLEIE